MVTRNSQENPQTRCDLCGSPDHHLILDCGRFNTPLQVVTCKRCGLVYLTHDRSPEELERFYRNEYRKQYGHMVTMPEWKLQSKQDQAERRWSALQTYIPKGCHLLEIGCAEGSFAAIAQAHGCEVSAVEIEPALARHAQSHGVMVHVGMFEDMRFPMHTFDVAVCFHILEHTSSPTAFLHRIHQALCSDGLLIIEMPDLMHPYGPLSYYFQLPHSYYFTEVTLKLLLRKVGFNPCHSELMQSKDRRIVARKTGGNPELGFAKVGDDWRAICKHLYSYQDSYVPPSPRLQELGHRGIKRLFGAHYGNKIIDKLIKIERWITRKK